MYLDVGEGVGGAETGDEVVSFSCLLVALLLLSVSSFGAVVASILGAVLLPVKIRDTLSRAW